MDKFSIIAIIGNTRTPEPMFETISKNPTSVPSSSIMLNFGRSKFGKPDEILPETQYHTIRVIINYVQSLLSR